MTVPPARQCTLPDCEREAVDLSHPGALCELHLEGGESAESVTEPEESGGEKDCQESETPAVESGVFPSTLADVEQWMVRGEDLPPRDREKAPYAPWADADGAKWGQESNRATFATAREWADRDPRVDSLAFIQTGADPFAFVDGDDVRDPETGAVHPAFSAILEHLGATYADVSTSGAGVHAYYRAPDGLPLDGNGQATFQLDTEPWGGNDGPPTVEIYATKHVCLATGDHVAGTPPDLREWDADALWAILEANGYGDREPVDHDTDRDRPDLEDHEPDATGADETASNIMDVLNAVDELEPWDVNLDTTKTGEDSTGWTTWDPDYRHSESGESLHYNGEGVFHDHKEGEAFGVLGLLAAENDILTKPWKRLSGSDWWDAVDAAREAGADIPEYDPTARSESEPVAVLPPAVRDLSHATTGWDWTQHSRTADAELSMDAARERCQAAIEDAYGRNDQVLVEALPTLGKSYGAIAAAAATGEQIAVFTGRGRKEQYEQLAEWCEEHGLSHNTLPSFLDTCDTATGEFGADAQEDVRDWYTRGATPQEIHKHGNVPCQQQEGMECRYKSAWRGAYEDEHGEPYDVLIGHYYHAYNDEVVKGRTPVFDEFPGEVYETQLDHLLAPAVTFFLQHHEALPFDDYTDLVEHRTDEARRADALAWFQERDLDVDETLVFQDSQVHAAAPLAVFTILAGPGDDLGNGWERADLDGDGVGLFDREQGRVHLLRPPALDYTSGVVALDGTPTKRMWELALGTRFSSHRQILTDAERREYVRDVLNLSLVRTTDAVKPYNSADHVAVDRDTALLETVRERHEQRPALITTATAEHEYDAAGVLEEFVAETTHYGNVLGSNRFDDTRLGAVIGSNHYGDRYIEKWGALAGRTVDRGDGKGSDLSYGAFGDRILTHMREHETLQAAMRFGRDGNGAVVYVHTDTLPEWVPVAGEGHVLTTRSEGMRQVLAAAEALGEWTTAEIAAHPAVDIGERQVRTHLTRLAEDYDVVEREVEGCGFVWRDDGLHRVSEHGDVELDAVDPADLGDEESAELARSSTYTWDFRTSASDSSRTGAGEASSGASADRAVANGGDPPPDDPD